VELDVFICYSTRDAEAAAAICERLEEGGIGCWIAPRNAVAGLPYSRQIVEAIEVTPILLLVLSANAGESRAVLGEVELATNRGKVILPVRIDGAPPSTALEFYIRAIHWFEASASFAVAAPELVRQVGSLLGRAAKGAVDRRHAGDAPRHNLPFVFTSFVGREHELGEIEAQLNAARLVTLCGPGGIGKTSLALEIGMRELETYRDGVWFVDLAQTEDESLVAKTFAATFALEESPNLPIADLLLAYLKSKSALLIADNCEHVVAGTARLVERILRGASGVKVLATTHEALGVPGEQTYAVPALSLPPPGAVGKLRAEQASEFGALELFANRARAANRTFALTDDNAPAVAAICTRLDGIALAIELVAASSNVMAPQELLESLDRRFLLLTGGTRTALPRQKTLRALIDWSYDRLSLKEQLLFRRLAIFAGSFTREDCAVVCIADTIAAEDVLELLDSLIAKSLVQVDFTTLPTRYRLLAPMRTYGAAEVAEKGELVALSRMHAEAFGAVAERLEAAWETTPDDVWKARAEPQLENWRAAMRWAFGRNGDSVMAARLVAALGPVWFSMAPSEGRRWVHMALNAVTRTTPIEVIAKLRLADAHLAMLGMRYAAALADAERALEIFTQLADPTGTALAQMFAGAARGFQGDVEDGTRLLESALAVFRRLGSQRMVASALIYLGTMQIIARKPDASGAFFVEALPLLRSVGAARAAAHIGVVVAEAKFGEGDARKAVELVTEALEADRALHNLDAVPFDLNNLAAYLISLERWDEAESRAREALTLAQERELTAATVWALQHLAAILAMRPRDGGSLDELRTAAGLLGYVEAQIETLELRREFTEQREYESALRAVERELGEEASVLLRLARGWSETQAGAAARF
jgi:predicted ATPase/tetratricopeptide (TPR) repeat protein